MASKKRPEKDTEDLLVFIAAGETKCGECGAELDRGTWITLQGERGALCLSCADLDHLVFLPPGDAALTRRARKHATLSAVVLKWSRTRKRYERQGLLVTEAGLQQAEQECPADQEIRARRQERARVQRAALDEAYMQRFAAAVRAAFPHCPPGREEEIALHACRKYSGRVGRSAAAKELAPEAVRLAVTAHVRHQETDYDRLLARGYDRAVARAAVHGQAQECLTAWAADR